MPITTPGQLREHLQLAIAVELSTVPTYLYAMYSIEDQSSDAALLIRSVVAEEMLHAVLATNLLLAIGGHPDFSSTDYMPTYPSDVPHHRPPLTLRLEPCSQLLIEELFLVIEQPEVHSEPAEDDIYESLGQFYHAIERGLVAVATTHDVFADPQPSRQMASASYYQPVVYDEEDSGGLSLIDSVEAANEAIHVIIHQGEGVSDEKWADPAHKELTHYYKFLQIAQSQAPIGTVAPAMTNPRGANYPPEVRGVSDLFNATYRFLYLTMNDIFQPGTEKDALVDRLYTLMSGVLSPLARHLMTMPVGDQVAGPTFEAYEFGSDDPLAHLVGLAERLATADPVVGAAHRVLLAL